MYAAAFQKQQQADDPPMQQPYLHRHRENFVLFAAGFQRKEEHDGFLWKKDDACCGREAALQKAWLKLLPYVAYPKSPCRQQ